MSASSLSTSALTSQNQQSKSYNPSPYSAATPYPNPSSDPMFAALLSETRSYVLSQTFASALSACLDRATEVLFDSLKEREVFGKVEDRPTEGDASAESTGSEVKKISLAKLLPSLKFWSAGALLKTPSPLIDVSIYRDV